jgi:ubiquinone/menaquinone biosynthesis C-methylase UbiE
MSNQATPSEDTGREAAQPMAPVQADFDRIALLPMERWSHNAHYHRFLLEKLPFHCANALEIGCGKGAFSRLLATRAGHVLALDLSPQMLRLAREASTAHPNIDFRLADITTYALPAAQFDCAATIATLHHLLLEETLLKMKQALKTGGTLLVLDLYKASTLVDILASAIAFPLDAAMKLLLNGHLGQPQATREAWAEHSHHERFLTLPQIRQICARVLPGAQVRRHVFWRYSIVWKKQ